jgi:hypothetical protein
MLNLALSKMLAITLFAEVSGFSYGVIVDQEVIANVRLGFWIRPV